MVFARSKRPLGTVGEIANSAASLAYLRVGAKVGKGSGSVPYKRRSVRLPMWPWGLMAMGRRAMRRFRLCMMRLIIWSPVSVMPVSLSVLPRRVNFFFSPSRRRNFISFKRAAFVVVE